MTAKEIYRLAIASLGYGDDDVLREKAIPAANAVYALLCRSTGKGKYHPIETLNDRIDLPQEVMHTAFLYGLAEKLALGTGDSEKQRYYAVMFDSARGGINRTDRVKTVV